MTLTNRPEYLESLSRFAAGTRWSDIGPDVRTRVGWILADTVAAIVGGASEPELEALSAAGARPVRLGPTVLRTSTAGAVALGALGVLTTRWSLDR